MAQTFTRSFLSAGQNGTVLSASSAYREIHYNNFGTIDEVWLYLSNTTETSYPVNIGWCSTLPTSNNGSTISIVLPARSGPTLVIPGLILPSGLRIVGQAVLDNTVVAYGFVNRISTG